MSRLAGGGARQAADAGFPQVPAHGGADLGHRIDDLVGRDMPHHTGQRHVGGRYGIHRADHVALDAGQFHQPGHRVADKALQVGQRHGERLGAGFGGAAFQVGEGSGSHTAGRAHLRLAAPFGAGQRGPGRHHLAKPGRHIQSPADGVLIRRAGPPQRQQHGRQNPAAAGGGGRHDPLHAGVALGGLEGFGNDLGVIAAAVQQPGRGGGLHLGGVPAGKAAGRTVGAAIVGAGLGHHLPKAAHPGPGLRLGQAAFLQVAAQDHFI